eukprot:Lithocolla_globosa_v1_NODE_115_length_6172_cov_14.462155.p7 type:complete len:153 gc:universal NODE_115_length_6172_cov_14.462155:1884-1426(-)
MCVGEIINDVDIKCKACATTMKIASWSKHILTKQHKLALEAVPATVPHTVPDDGDNGDDDSGFYFPITKKLTSNDKGVNILIRELYIKSKPFRCYFNKCKKMVVVKGIHYDSFGLHFNAFVVLQNGSTTPVMHFYIKNEAIHRITYIKCTIL